jgi:hypothetical protein
VSDGLVLRNAEFVRCHLKVELAMIQDTVSNSMLGKMRMQFWRDAVKQISDVCVAYTTNECSLNMKVA